MKVTYWPAGDIHYQLRVNEDSSSEEIEAEIEYWMTEISLYGLDGPYRAALLKAVRWMNELI